MNNIQTNKYKHINNKKNDIKKGKKMKAKEKNIIKSVLVIFVLIIIIVGAIIFIQKAEKVTYAYEDIETATAATETAIENEPKNKSLQISNA